MSTQRAFVIQFLQRPGEDGFTGRVEHVGSGEAAHFSSPDELLSFLVRLKGSAAAGGRPRAAAAAAAGTRRGRGGRSPA